MLMLIKTHMQVTSTTFHTLLHRIGSISHPSRPAGVEEYRIHEIGMVEYLVVAVKCGVLGIERHQNGF